MGSSSALTFCVLPLVLSTFCQFHWLVRHSTKKPRCVQLSEAGFADFVTRQRFCSANFMLKVWTACWYGCRCMSGSYALMPFILWLWLRSRRWIFWSKTSGFALCADFSLIWGCAGGRPCSWSPGCRPSYSGLLFPSSLAASLTSNYCHSCDRVTWSADNSTLLLCQ